MAHFQQQDPLFSAFPFPDDPLATAAVIAEATSSQGMTMIRTLKEEEQEQQMMEGTMMPYSSSMDTVAPVDTTSTSAEEEDEDASMGLFVPAPYSPEGIARWQFGDAPASMSPRRDLLQPPTQMYALDNQFFDGPLDWDLPNTGSSIQENMALLGLASSQQQQQQCSQREGQYNSATTETIGFTRSISEMNFPFSQLDIKDESRTEATFDATHGIFISDAPVMKNSNNKKKRWSSFSGLPSESTMLLETEADQKKKKHMRSASASSATMMADLPGMFEEASNSPSTSAPTPRTRSLIRSSGYRGVSKCSKDGRWQARIRVGQSVRYLGRFLTQEEAAQCYDEAARTYHGDKAVLNFRRPGEEHLALSKKASVMARMNSQRSLGEL